MTSTMLLSTTDTSYTGTGLMAGNVLGAPVTRLNALPCFQHSSSLVAGNTSPSLSEMSAWLHVSPNA